jgi:hypothetical protein
MLKKLGFYLPWVCVFLESMNIWIGCAQNSVRSMLIVLHYTFILLTRFLSYMFRTEQILCFCHFVYFHLEIKKKNNVYSVTISYLLCCLRVKHIILSRVPNLFTKTGPFLKWQRGLDQCHYNLESLLPLYTTYEMEKFPSTLCVQRIYNDYPR